MKNTEEILQALKENFPDFSFELKSDLPVEGFIICNPLVIDKISHFLHDNPELNFDSLINLSGVDEIKANQLSVYYHLESTELKHKLVLKVVTDRNSPEVASVTDIWKGANWHEREAYDMFGIKFLNHPDLRRILMPYDWEAGHPLRKDYENPEFYQGMKVPF
ncbi:MAG: NADH-quinone oxidoreductase subunit C [Ignavibacteriota bacterium]|nr:NADH-quinone oxidoreductase subunit C [Ignavibacteriota bacterium]MBW7843251.1 NADH-quinone oxidoreductase subunit C [Ignavibacterium sp.]MCO6449074.1 NADH-quinone oxidoreductase subunit C [Ignavibacterium album]MCZ2267651.1 NADH-quinone oxidoreductase subunit C [Ignavibacteriales bacterium]HOJ07002.1 NADH-quinone oxidoreductase subunit C [Ignavibacteriaceae bacterium]